MVVRACHSFIHTPGVCFCVGMRACVLLITPYHKSKSFLSLNEAKNWSVEAHTETRRSPRLLQSWLCYSSTEEFCLRLRRNLSSPSDMLSHNVHSHSYTFGQQQTPVEKSPKPFTSARYTSPLPLDLLLQGETFPRRGKKHLVVISFSFFLHSTFPSSLRSISKSKNKQRPLSEWKTVALHHTDPLCP